MSDYIKPELRVLLTGGGTGGHVAPLVAVAEALIVRAKAQGFRVRFLHLGLGNQIERTLLAPLGIKTISIEAGKFRRYFSAQNVLDAFRTPRGMLQSIKPIVSFDPQVVFSKGGFVSVPSVITAKTLGRPVLIHESDAVFGLANKILARYADTICVTLPSAERGFKKYGHRVVRTGLPLRESMLHGDPQKGRRIFHVQGQKPVLLILGGSQGSQRLNEFLLSIIKTLLQKYQIIHQCGAINMDTVKDAALEHLGDVETHELGSGFHAMGGRYCAFPFLAAELAHAYAVTDAVIMRAGSNVFEVAALGKPTILIPLPDSAGGHQLANAEAFVHAEAAVLMEQDKLDPDTFLETLDQIVQGEWRDKLSRNIKKMIVPKAADKVVDELLRVAKGEDAERIRKL